MRKYLLSAFIILCAAGVAQYVVATEATLQPRSGGWSGGSFTLPAEAPDGSAGAPSYTFSSDTTCGAYYGGSNDMCFATVGAAAWCIDTTQSWVMQSAGSHVELLGAGTTNDESYLYSHGWVGQYRGADEAPADTYITGQSPYEYATVNTTGGDLLLAAGEGTSLVSIYGTVGVDNTCNALDTVTLTIDGTDHVLTYGTDWCLAGCADVAAIASSLSTEIIALSAGVTSGATSPNVAILRDETATGASRYSVAASDDTCATTANGTDGVIYAKSNLTVNGLLLISDSGTAYIEIESSGTNDGVYVYPHGVLGKTREADEDPARWYLIGQNAYEFATVNTTGRDMYLSGGSGTKNLTVTYAGCTGADYVSIFQDSAVPTTRTYGTHWCSGVGADTCSDDATAAERLRVALDALTGITATRSGSVVGVKRDLSSTSSVFINITNNDNTCTTETVGTDGAIYLGGSGFYSLSYNTSIGSADYSFNNVYGSTLYAKLGGGMWSCPTDDYCAAAGGAWGYGFNYQGIVSQPSPTVGGTTWTTRNFKIAGNDVVPTSTKTGGNLVFAGGVGARKITMTDFHDASCAGKTVTINVDGTTTTWTWNVDWCIGGEATCTTTAIMATNLEALIEAVTGVTSSVTASTSIQWYASDRYAYHDISASGTAIDGVCITDAQYADGDIQSASNLVFYTTNTYDIGASAGNKPKDGYFAGDVYVGDDLDVTADITAATYNAGVLVTNQTTTPVSMSATDVRGNVWTNKGAGGAIVLNLPTAVAGYQVTVYVSAAQNINIVAAAGDTIDLQGHAASAAAGKVCSSTQEDSVILVAIDGTEWVSTSIEDAGWAVDGGCP